MARVYIPVWARINHEEYDEERALAWLNDHPNMRSKMLPKKPKANVPEKEQKEQPLSLVIPDGTDRMSSAQVRQVMPYWEDYGASMPQARFAATYATNGFDVQKAYKEAVNSGVSKSAAAAMGARMLQEPEVLKCLERFTFDWIGQCRIELNTKILQTLRAQAFYDPAMFIDAQGQPAFSTLEDIPVDMRCCVVSIRKKYYGKDADTFSVEVELVDRRAALRELSAYINLMKDAKETKTVSLSKDTESLLTGLFTKGMEVGKKLNDTPDAEVVK